MNTFYVREDILLIFYLNETWDCIIKDMAQSKRTKKNRAVIKQSSDNVFLLFKRTSFSFVQRNNFDYYKIINDNNSNSDAKPSLDNRFSNFITMNLFIQTSQKGLYKLF